MGGGKRAGRPRSQPAVPTLGRGRTVVSALFENEVFGWISLGAAVLTLIRPVLPLFTIGLAASAFGIVLHNAGLSGLAAALLIMSFARPVVDQS